MDTPSDTRNLDSEDASNGDAAECPPFQYDLHIDAIPNVAIQEFVWMEGESRVRVVATWSAPSGLEELRTCLYAYPGIGDNETEVIGDAIDMLHDDQPQFRAMRAEIIAGRNPWIAYAVGARRFTTASEIGVEELDYVLRRFKIPNDPAGLTGVCEGERVQLGELVHRLVIRRDTGDQRDELAKALAVTAKAASAAEVAWQWEAAAARQQGPKAVRELVQSLR